MNSLIKLGLVQGHELVNEMNQILDADDIFSPLVHRDAILLQAINVADAPGESASDPLLVYPPNTAPASVKVENGYVNPVSGSIMRDGYRVVDARVNVKHGSGWNSDTPLINPAILSIQSSATLDSSTTFTLGNTNFSNIGFDTPNFLGTLAAGTAVAFRATLRRLDSDTNPLRIQVSDGGVGGKFYCVIPESGSFVIGVIGVVSEGSDHEIFRIGNPAAAYVRQFEITNVQFEIVTGLADQVPSEYLGTSVQVSSDVVNFAYSNTTKNHSIDSNQILTELPGADIPRSRLGLITHGSFNQHLNFTSDLVSAEPVSLSAGTYTCWLEGAGSIAVSSASVTGTATEATPFTFTLASTETVTFTPTGVVDIANVVNKNVHMPWTDLSAASACNDVQLTLADIGFDGSTDGQVTLQLIFDHDFADLPASDLSIISLNDETGAALLYHKANHALAVFDGATSLEASAVIVKDTVYLIDIKWKVGGNVSIWVNGVEAGSVAWVGDWAEGATLSLCKGYEYKVLWQLVEIYDQVIS